MFQPSLVSLLIALAAIHLAPQSPTPASVEPETEPATRAVYDPLAVPADFEPHTLELAATRGNRAVPLLVYLPASPSPAPVVLISHGLGGSRYGSSFLGKHWSARGFVAVFLQHPGSDQSVWKGKRALQALSAMQQAASGENLNLRAHDVALVLDSLETWSQEADHALTSRLDLAHVGMSGHSFGGLTTQVVSGMGSELLGGRAPLADARLDAALVLSPSKPKLGKAEAAFATVAIPWMLMTGTRDESLIGGQTPASRREVYPALPKTNDRYGLVLDQAEHSVFTDRALPGDRHARNPNHHRAILALSTAFWDAYLLGKPEAKTWLQIRAAKSVLEERDAWQWAEGTAAARGNSDAGTELKDGPAR